MSEQACNPFLTRAYNTLVSIGRRAGSFNGPSGSSGDSPFDSNASLLLVLLILALIGITLVGQSARKKVERETAGKPSLVSGQR